MVHVASDSRVEIQNHPQANRTVKNAEPGRLPLSQIVEWRIFDEGPQFNTIVGIVGLQQLQ
jgi:hypothetical protein